MIKDNQKRLNRLHILLDILVTSAAYALAWFIVVSGKVLPVDVGVLKPQIYFMALVCTQTDTRTAFRICQYL